MNWRPSPALVAIPATALLAATGCNRDTGMLDVMPHPPEAVVFIDDFASGVDFAAFGGSKTDALAIDRDEFYRGSASLKFTIPVEGDPSGGYAGGAFFSAAPRDLTGFDALTFYARASTASVVNTVGLGNDATGTSMFHAEMLALPVSTTWTKYIVPIPLASKLNAERGLFFMAENSEHPVGYDLWFDDVLFERTGAIANARPAIATDTIHGEVGTSVSVPGTEVVFDAGGTDRTMIASPAYFTFTSSDAAVAAVEDNGDIEIVGPGSATITAALGSVQASGALTVNASAPPSGAPEAPTLPAADVISLFSDAYQDVPVDTWSADWDNADVQDVEIGGTNLKKYTNLSFAGIEFTSNQVNASAMTGFHLDLWTSDASAFRVKLVDFGADGAFGGGDDTEHEVTLNTESTPAIAANAWNSVDIPLSAFAGLASRSNLAQLIISGASPTVYIGNVYFFKTAASEPTSPAPTPTAPAANVISLFSDAYDDVQVDTWSASWDQADVEDVDIAGNAAKKYANLTFAGIEFTSQPVDATASTHFHIDVWTPDPTTAPAALRFKLVDFGADRAFGGGDDVEHEVTVNASSDPPLATGAWLSYSIPLTDFTNLATRAALAQLILSGEPNTVYVDNVYFSTSAPSAPTEPAPAPTHSADQVISIFSDAYQDIQVDTWSADWDQADVEDVQIAGNAVKKYTNLSFAGIEFVSQPVDATASTHFHIDVWTPDSTESPATLRFKLVDFGADGAFGGGDDVEHEVVVNASYDPPLATGTWIRYDIPLTEFANLTTRASLAQLLLSGEPNTVYVDNIYLHN